MRITKWKVRELNKTIEMLELQIIIVRNTFGSMFKDWEKK